MKTVMQHISRAFDIISTIPVSEGNVEKMAAAKQELRNGYAILRSSLEAAENKKTTPEVKNNAGSSVDSER